MVSECSVPLGVGPQGGRRTTATTMVVGVLTKRLTRMAIKILIMKTYSRFKGADLSRSMSANFVMPQRRDQGAMAAMGRQQPPWSGCIFLPSFRLANCLSEVCQPKNQQKPNHWPTRHPHQYLAEWDLWSTHPLHIYRMKMPVPYDCTDPPSWNLGVVGARWSSGCHGWIVFCVHLSYFNLEYLSHLIFILIPLWRGFYFREEMLSDVHTEDVSYRRTKPWCNSMVELCNHTAQASSHHACAEDGNLKHPHLPVIDGDNWVDWWLVVGWIWGWRTSDTWCT